MTPTTRWLCVVLAAWLFGFGAGIEYAMPGDVPDVGVEEALEYSPPTLPGDRVNPNYRDVVITTLQHAVGSAAHAGARARLYPVTPPCRVAIDCEEGAAP